MLADDLIHLLLSGLVHHLDVFENPGDGVNLLDFIIQPLDLLLCLLSHDIKAAHLFIGVINALRLVLQNLHFVAEIVYQEGIELVYLFLGLFNDGLFIVDPGNSGLHIHGHRIQVAQPSGNATDHFIFYGNVFGLDFQFADLLHQAVKGLLGLVNQMALPKELFIVTLHLGKNTLQLFRIAGMAFYSFLVLLDPVIATVEFSQGVFHDPDFYGGRSQQFFHVDNILHLTRNAIEHMLKPLDVAIRRLE